MGLPIPPLPSRTKLPALAAAVFCVAVGVYLNGLEGGFVYDDVQIVVENPAARGQVSPATVFGSAYWRHGLPTASAPRPGGLYRPLAVLSYVANWRLGANSPLPFHAVNILLHAVVSALLLLLFARLGFSFDAAALGAAAFAVLPIHAEAVSWTVGRAELLGAFFIVAAWNLMHETAGWGRLTCGLACYALALLSKESAAPFPAAWVLGELFTRWASAAEVARRRGAAWLAAFGVLLVYLEWRALILGSALVVGLPYFTSQRPLIVALTMSKFLLRGWLAPMAVGLGQCADYSRPVFPDAGVGDLVAWAGLAFACAAAIGSLIVFQRRRPAWAFAVLVFFCFAAPLSNLLVPMEIIGAERIMYLPSVGFCMLAAAAWDGRRRGGASGRGFWLLPAAGLAWWSFQTIARNRVWRE